MINIEKFSESAPQDKLAVFDSIQTDLENDGYKINEVNNEKPWGGYIRLTDDSADGFITEYFPGLSPEDARLGIKGANLSPKILIVAPGQRLSLQYHHRRAERWAFLTEGLYCKSTSDEETEPIRAMPGEVVQFAEGERHRLLGLAGLYVFVAEIWQHTKPGDLSDEEDIVRLSDDYNR